MTKGLIVFLFVTLCLSQNIVFGPVLSRLTNNSVYINWTMDGSATATVNYGVSDINNVINWMDKSTGYSIKIDSLLPGTRYYYQIECGEYSSPVYTFETIPSNGKISFVVYGDNRSDSGISSSYTTNARNILNGLDNKSPDFVIHTGDIVYRGYDFRYWQWYFRTVDNFGFFAQNSVYFVAGNHERIGALPHYYLDLLNMPMNNMESSETYYSFVINNCKFICLDGNQAYSSASEYWLYECGSGSEQYEWCRNELINSQNHTFIFVFLHYPLYSSGTHGGSAELRNIYEPLFEQYGVDVVFAGHDHCYERTVPINGVVYVITGGGGANLYSQDTNNSWSALYDKSYNYVYCEIDGTQTNFVMFRGNGTIGDMFSLTSDISLPVELSEFTVSNLGDRNMVSWSTESEREVWSFVVSRSIDGVTFSDVYSVEAGGNSSTIHEYFFYDHDVVPNRTYYYRLAEIRIDGVRAVIGNTSISILDDDFIIYPNPANATTFVKFNVNEPRKIRCDIYNLLGQKTMELFNGLALSGGHKIDVNVDNLASGVYFIALRDDKMVRKKKFIVMK